MGDLEYTDLCTEEQLQKQLSIIKRQDTILQQIEEILHQMEQLAILSACDAGDWLADRMQLQEQLERLQAELEQLGYAL